MGEQFTHISRYLCFLLRHHPEAARLTMDRHGWVGVQELIENVNAAGAHQLTREKLELIVAEDSKGRYRFSPDGSRIKVCQGHSLPWVEPELEIMPPPEYLYHGTNRDALMSIRADGYILRMERHAVHMQADVAKAWRSAKRWRGKHPVVLKIAAKKLAEEQNAVFGRSENDVWCCEKIPTAYIVEYIYP